MNITYYGHSCFKIISNSLVIITDPFDKSVGLVPPRLGADIITVSHDHYDHNNTQAISGSPFIINGPGEYEIKGISIKGILSFHDNCQGQERGLNTIYLIETEGIKLCHLGDFGQDKLIDTQFEAINNPDILFIPVGGKYTIDAASASSLISQVEPKIVLPMHYKISGLKIDLPPTFSSLGKKGREVSNQKVGGLAPLDKFLKEMGIAKKEPIDKLTIKKKDLPQETEVMVMKV